MQRNWLTKGVRDAVKKQKDPDKFIKAHNRATAEKQGAKAKQTERLIERLEVVEEPRKEWELRTESAAAPRAGAAVERKSKRLNSSHANISYAVFCLQKKTLTPCARP